MTWILIAAGVASALLGEWIDAGALLAIVLLNAAIGFHQELRSPTCGGGLESEDGLCTTDRSSLHIGDAHRINDHDILSARVVLLEGDRRRRRRARCHRMGTLGSRGTYSPSRCSRPTMSAWSRWAVTDPPSIGPSQDRSVGLAGRRRLGRAELSPDPGAPCSGGTSLVSCELQRDGLVGAEARRAMPVRPRGARYADEVSWPGRGLRRRAGLR